MSTLDFIYLSMLVLSIPLGYVVKNVSSVLVKRLICLLTGVFIVLVLVGWKASYHSFIVVLGNYFIIHYLVKYGYRCHTVSFAFSFAYLLFFRTCHYLGFEAPPKHSNAVQLLITIRTISLALEIQEATLGEVKPSKWSSASKLNYSFLDHFTYAYSYIGLMTGPFYKYQTFQDMLYQTGVSVRTMRKALLNLKPLLILVGPYLFLKSKFPLEYFESKEFLDDDNMGFLYTTFNMTCTVCWFRWRYHIGWLLAESLCIAAGLGYYPDESNAKPGKGPDENSSKKTDPSSSSLEGYEGEQENFQTVHNIDILGIELSYSFKKSIKHWNKTVQYWMQKNGRILFGNQSRNGRMIGTFLVSAYWHGIHAGYYVFAVVAFMMILAEYHLEKCVTSLYNDTVVPIWVNCLRHFFHWRGFEFAAVPFMFLRFDLTFIVWKRLSFSGFIYMASILLFSKIAGSFSKKTPPSTVEPILKEKVQ